MRSVTRLVKRCETGNEREHTHEKIAKGDDSLIYIVSKRNVRSERADTDRQRSETQRASHHNSTGEPNGYSGTVNEFFDIRNG